jgi:transposase InsO family protein
VNMYPFIEAEKVGRRNVKRACELMQVSRSAFYQHARGSRSQRQRVDETLTGRITAVHEASKGTYGAPRVHAELAAAGHRHGRKRVARLMRTAGIRGKCPRRWRTTTIPDSAAAARPDLIDRDFGPNPAAIDTRWCGDITYIYTWEGWLYLATVIDLASRRVVGWAVADHLRTDLVDAALTDALTRRRPTSGLIFHSDRGCQYTSAQHARLAARHGVQLSVGRRGQCWDNAVAESFSPPSRPNSCTARPGRPAPPPGRRYSSTWKAGTTPAAGTPASAISARPPTRPAPATHDLLAR